MPDEVRSPPRARPVADLPRDGVLGRAEELAKRWTIALILARPLDGIGDLPLEELAREAPSLCAQVLRALESDVELDRLSGRGASSPRGERAPAGRLGAILDPSEPAAAVDAVEALRGVVWEALLDRLDEPSAHLLGDVSDRLAYVCAVVLAAAVDAAPASQTQASGREGEAGADMPETSARDFARARPQGRRAVIVDERPPVPARAQASPLSSDGSPVPPRARTGEIEIRDERSEDGPAAWIGSIGRQLERFELDGRPFAVLLIELVDIERLRRGELAHELAVLAAGLERALAEELGSWSCPLTRERPGRCWLLAPGADQAGARELAERLVRAVASRASDRGAPLEVAIGIAVCPEDGREAAALAAYADVGLYAARSSARASAARPATPVDESA